MNMVNRSLLNTTSLLFIHGIRVHVVRKIVHFQFQSVFVNNQLSHIHLINMDNYINYND